MTTKPQDTQRDRRALEIFGHAVEMAGAGAVAGYLEEACGGDPALKARVELLLAHHVGDSFVEQPAAGPGASAGIMMMEQPGDSIGRYKLLEKIGEGGCGVVYMAEQEEPVRRRVALKVIKPGMDSLEVIARFEAERQALAMMDHPNIAKVHDGGVTGTGRPYFVMELVRGVRITDYCQEHGLNTRDRLDLFMQVCSAVQHAHQKGIIHRDLKPSNILVSSGGFQPLLDRSGSLKPPSPQTEVANLRHVKVIDFGIAKATEQKLTDKTLFTRFAQFVGTPAYMSPEQAGLAGADIDTRSDIYSLGVLLYELLTGTTPFDAQELLNAGFDEMRRIIRETEPPKPSTRLTQSAKPPVARHSKAAPGQLPKAHSKEKCRLAPDHDDPPQERRATGHSTSQSLPSDLDWIVMKCLEKDRARRYETATGLAADIQRHLSSEPVAARPASAAYRFRKMVRRNKVPFAAAGAVAAALIAGLVVSTWMFFREKRALDKERQSLERAVAAELAQRGERTKAETEAAKSRQIARFLEDMLRGVGPSVALGRDTTLLREILEKTAARIGTDFNDQPAVEASLRQTLGRVYFALGDSAQSEAMHRTALERLRELHKDGHADVASSLVNLANALSAQRKLDEAGTLFREALAMNKKLLGPEHAEVATTLNNLALVLFDQRKLPEAEAMFREALTLHRKLRGDEHMDTTATLNNLALVLEDMGKLADAEAMFRESLALKRKLYSGDHPQVASNLRNLAGVLNARGKRDEAVATYREALAMMRRLYPDGHPHLVRVLNGLGLLLTSQGQYEEAEQLHQEALDWAKQKPDNDLPLTLSHLGVIRKRQERLPEAEAFFREALETGKALKSPPFYRLPWCSQLASVLEMQGKPADAEPFRREALEIARAQPHPDPQTVAQRLLDLEEDLFLQQKYADAESLLLPGNEALQNDPKIEGKLTRDFLTHLVRLYEAWKKPEKASEWREKLAAFENEPSGTAAGQDKEAPKSEPGRKTP